MLSRVGSVFSFIKASFRCEMFLQRVFSATIFYLHNFFKHTKMYSFNPWMPVFQEYSLAVPLPFHIPETTQKVGVFVHVFYTNLFPELLESLRNIPGSVDICISTNTHGKAEEIRRAASVWTKGKLIIRVMPNRGRDIAPFLVGFRDLIPSYDYILHVHTKSSPHEPALRNWRQFLYANLIGSKKTVESILHCFEMVPELGILSPQHLGFLRPWINWGQNYPQWRALVQKMGLSPSEAQPMPAIDFPSGSMFWARPAALQPLLQLNLDYEQFPDEMGQQDGTLAHVIERSFFYSCESSGLIWFKIARPYLYEFRFPIKLCNSSTDVARFVRNKNKRLITSK